MNKLRSLVLGAALAVLPIVPTYAQSNEVKVEAKSVEKEGDLVTDKVRTTVKAGNYFARVDVNDGRQSQTAFEVDLMKGDKYLRLLTSSTLPDTINGVEKKQDFAIGAVYKQKFDKVTLKFLNMNAFTPGDKSFHRGRVSVYGKNVDVSGEIKLPGSRKAIKEFHVGLHNDNWYAGYGKDTFGTHQMGLIGASNSSLGIFATADYNPKTGTFNMTSWSSTSNADLKGVYNIGEARFVMDLNTFRPYEAAQPIFPSFLISGDVAQKIRIASGRGRTSVTGMIGGKLTDNLSVAAGVDYVSQQGQKRKITPSIEASLDVPLGKNSTMHIDARRIDGQTTVYSYVKGKF